MMDKQDLLLTDEEIMTILDSGEKPLLLNEGYKLVLEAQLAKAHPILEKQTREEMWDILESYRTGDNEKGLLYVIPHRDWVTFRQALKGK